jgi:hypothetical protein
MAIVPLKDEEILIGSAVDKPATPLVPIVEAAGETFAGNCPLWTYILAEAMHHRKAVDIPVTANEIKPGGLKINTPQLGPVGGRIVAEVFLGLLFGDQKSILTLDPNWQPPAGSDYRLRDFVKYALG